MARRSTILGCGLLLAAAAGTPALADDTEIFKSQLTAQAEALLKPNVLFVIDTSGSMADPVPDTVPPYEENREYSGDCRRNRVYWSTTGIAPDCDTDQWFKLDKLRCAAAIDREAPAATISGPLDFPGGLGIFQDRLAQYRNTEKDWVNLSTTIHDPPHVECRDDRGEHGENNADTQRFITTGGARPWQSAAAGETDWGSTGEFYTLFSGNYMNYFNNPPSGTPTRLEIVKGAVKSLIEANHDDINAGLMRFDTKTHCSRFDTITFTVPFPPFVITIGPFCISFAGGNRGGPIVFPVSNIDANADKVAFQAAVNALTPGGLTPLAETLYEAAQYYRGGNAFFGTNPPTPNDIQSVASSLDPATPAPPAKEYLSPIVGECQKNFIVYLTDGEPTGDFDADSQIATLLGQTDPLRPPLTLGGCDFTSGDNCLDEVAEFLATQDNNQALTGPQTVETYMIGFLEGDVALMTAAAEKGGGDFFQANDALQLSSAFTQILTQIQASTSTFSAPSVSVNAFNRITNRKELFFSLFTPTSREHWPGNIKRYELDCLAFPDASQDRCADGADVDTLPDPPVILDASNPRKPAVDPNTGFFADDARSDWTLDADAPDGADTQKGGTASLLGLSGNPPAGSPDPANRTVYTYTGGYTEISPGVFRPAAGANDLSIAANRVNRGNAALTDAMLYPTGSRQRGEPRRDELIDWAAGRDVNDVDDDGDTDDARPQQGDALHSKPVLVGYGTTAADPDLTLYVATNDGYLHGFDIDTGLEVFSFIPKELLRRLPGLFVDQARSSSRTYGLDGPITVWFKDDDGDGVPEPEDGDGILQPGRGEFVWLFVGQRRGGRRYYAIDVTDRSAPVLKWKIDPDTAVAGNPAPSAGDFDKLGQTWSAPRVIRIKVDGTEKDALVFGGGYDSDQDSAVVPVNDDIGNAVFIVEAATGEPIWSTVSGPGLTGLPTMTNSVPADVRVFDITGDGLADRIYVGDTRAQLWRFDINNENEGVGGGAGGANRLVTFTLFAELQKASASTVPSTEAENRRLFNSPDVSLAFPEDRPPFLAIVIGSGKRMNPLNKVVEDRIYMLRDEQVGNISDPNDYNPPITENNLLDVTTNLAPSLGGATRDDLFFTDQADPTNSRLGWMVKLANFSSDPTATGDFIGEKVLADSITFEGRILVTTFTPPTTPLDAECKPNLGKARTYFMGLLDATPEEDLDESGDETPFTRADRSVDLLRGGIPPEVTILFPPLKNAEPVALVAAEKLPLTLSQTPVKTFWFQQEMQ